MRTRIWRMAGVSLLALSISAQVLADDNNRQQQQQHNEQRQQQQRGFELQRQQQQNQQRSFNQDQQRNQQQRQQQQQQYQQQRQQEQLNQQRQIQQNQQQRADQQRQQQERERNQQQQQQQQQRQQQLQQQQRQQQQQQQLQQRQLQDRQSNLPIQRRPDAVVQTQEPRQGFYRDQPRDNNPWRGGDHRPDNGRPGGHGDGWGGGPRYRPGYEIDRMPGGYSRVPYHGNDYFYSGGYWYRPQGPRYVVVAPPRGVRVRYLPDYAQQVWLGSALFFLAAGTYYTYEQSTQEYVVAEPPQGVEPVYSPQQIQQPADPYDVIAYPANGQTQQQVEQDRYDCYRYAVQQSNFDPAAATYQPAPEVVGIYRQAMAGCYAGRGYSVQQ